MAFACRHFDMSARTGGATARAHFEAAARMGSKAAIAELAKDTSPGPLAYLWGLFLELHGRRGAGGMGPSPITWPDLAAWASLTRRTLMPWEYDVLAMLDNAFFAATAKVGD